MLECCILGCSNRPTKERTLKFYTIPTGNSVRPFKLNRRRLWLEAIEKANGSVADLSADSRICSAHFISGQISMDNSNPDFVPSVFVDLHHLRSREGTRLKRRQCTPTKSHVRQKSPRKSPEKPLEEVHLLNNSVLMETDQCKPSEEMQEATTFTLTKDEEVLKEKDEIKLSIELVTADLSPYKKPILLLKSVVDPTGGFRCEVCDGSFTDGSVLAKHKQLHDQEKSGEIKLPTPFEVSERSTNMECNLTDRQICVEDSLFKCNMCDRSFPTIHNLKRHKLLHLRDSRKCTQCGTLFCKRHNHVLFQPQISTESNFEEDTVTGDTLNVSCENQLPETSKRYNLELDEYTHNEAQSSSTTASFLSTDSQTDKKQEQSGEFAATHLQPRPTSKPQKTGLLSAFISFVSKAKAKPEPSTTTQPKVGLSTDLIATQTAPEPSTSLKPDAGKVFNNSSAKPEISSTFIVATPKSGSSTVNTATSPKPQPGQCIKLSKVEQSTASISKPLTPDAVKTIMSYVCKSESTRSSVPQRITFMQTAEPQKPEVSIDHINALLKPTAEPIAAPPKPGPLPVILPDTSTTPATQTKRRPKKHATAGYVHGSRPPSPILVKRPRGPGEAPSAHYPKHFVQPHLPQSPVFPPNLQMFSPQYLTSAMLDVKRNYRYILSKVKKEKHKRSKKIYILSSGGSSTTGKYVKK